MNRKRRVGLIVNPFCGIGGRVGLKGSDGTETRTLALALGAKQEAMGRTADALKELGSIRETTEIVTCSGDMGENSCIMAGFNYDVVYFPDSEVSNQSDTIKAARHMLTQGIELLIFAGGDGTARDIFTALNGAELPVIGIPAGVKIHSAVYAINPRSAGAAVYNYLINPTCTLTEAEVMDIDEELFRKEVVNTRLYGFLLVPTFKQFMQNVKSGGYSQVSEISGIASTIIESMEEDIMYIIGPGSTTRPIMEFLNLKNTLLGVDVIKNKKLVANDVTEEQLFHMMQGEKVKAVITVIGGQGHILGRGNQQLSPRVIRYIGKENFIIIASQKKLADLKASPLLVDTGDSRLDEDFSGCVRVTIGQDTTTICKVSNSK